MVHGVYDIQHCREEMKKIYSSKNKCERTSIRNVLNHNSTLQFKVYLLCLVFVTNNLVSGKMSADINTT